MTRKTMTADDRAQALSLAEQAGYLTREMADLEEQHAAKALERAHLWRQAIALGMTRTELAEHAGIHHSRIGKAIERRASASAL